MKFSRTLFFILFSLFITACTSQPFCSLNCGTPKQSTPYLDPEMANALTAQGILLMPKGDDLKIVIPTDAFFRPNLPALKDDKKPTLDQLARLLKTQGAVSVKIVGYSDSIGNRAAQQKLTLERARAILAYLWVRGLDAEHLYAVGLGSQDLVGDPNYTDANAANRRIEINVHAHCTTCF